MDAVVLTGPCNKDAVAMADIFQVSDLIFTNNDSSDGIFLYMINYEDIFLFEWDTSKNFYNLARRNYYYSIFLFSEIAIKLISGLI